MLSTRASLLGVLTINEVRSTQTNLCLYVSDDNIVTTTLHYARLILGSGRSNLRGVNYDNNNNVTTPWSVKFNGQVLKRFYCKRAAANFYLDLYNQIQEVIRHIQIKYKNI